MFHTHIHNDRFNYYLQFVMTLGKQLKIAQNAFERIRRSQRRCGVVCVVVQKWSTSAAGISTCVWSFQMADDLNFLCEIWKW